MKSLLLLTFILIGCAQESAPEVSEEFLPFVAEFEKDMQTPNTSTIEFGTPVSGAAGWCYARRITIRRDTWDAIGPYQRKALIYHELGHCVLYKGHTPDTRGPDGCTSNIMHPWIDSDDCYYRHPERFYFR